MMSKKSPPVVVLRVHPNSERSGGRLFTAFLFSFMLNGFIIVVFFISNVFAATAMPPDADLQSQVIPFDPPDQPEPKIERILVSTRPRRRA